MIELTNLAGQKIIVNLELVRFIEGTPDSILCFLDGTRLPVRESFSEIQTKYSQFKQQIALGTEKWISPQSSV
ncbi:MAG: flagellar FlbD family protein [Pseudobdellovibrionaceae bacterium]|jgi:flagellar protein FlbD